ncbi:MAG: hypothetical protein KGL39_23560 [Patescibacteria group bacterium]|nr:hypothetical protein [Patescibacteria group bacterium]
MANAFDARLVEASIVLPTETFSFSGDFDIRATGTNFGCPIQNTCTCRIDNLSQATRNAILTLASPLIYPPANNPAAAITNAEGTRPPVILTLKIGRQSSGTFELFYGNIFSCQMTQPPDIGIIVRSLTQSYNASLNYNLQLPATTRLSAVAYAVAQKNGLFLDFEATDKNISNFNVSGSAQGMLTKLSQLGNIHVGVDKQTLWVTDAGKARKNTGFTLNDSTGLVGIPQVTEQGVIAKMMINSAITIGGAITIESFMNPAANGTFKVMKMDYDIASRDNPFWYTLLCQNLALYDGTQ